MLVNEKEERKEKEYYHDFSQRRLNAIFDAKSID